MSGIALGVVLVLLGLGVALAVVGLVLQGLGLAPPGLQLLEPLLEVVPPSFREPVVGAGTALAALLGAVGVASLTRGQRRSRARALEEAAARSAGLEARHRLLEERARDLERQVRDLEQRRAEVRSELERLEREAEARRLDLTPGSHRAIVLPESPEGAGQGPSQARAEPRT